MSRHAFFTTLETNSEPCLIVTNNDPDISDGSVLARFYYYTGTEASAPQPNMDDGNSFLLGQEEIRMCIAVLSEFLIDEQETPND